MDNSFLTSSKRLHVSKENLQRSHSNLADRLVISLTDVFTKLRGSFKCKYLRIISYRRPWNGYVAWVDCESASASAKTLNVNNNPNYKKKWSKKCFFPFI